MNNKKILLVLIVVFALLMVGATALYKQLSRDAFPDQLVNLNNQPTNPPTQPTNPPTQPTDPSTQPTDPSTQPTDSSTRPTDPPTQPTDPSTQPTNPPTQPTDPSAQPMEPPTQPQHTAPDFVVYDAEGKEVRLSDFFGKPIVLNFWTSWCTYCKMEMPYFQEKFQELGEEVTFLMVNVTGYDYDTQAAAEAYIESEGYTFPVFFDLTLDAAIAYGVNAFPMTFFIDAAGNPVVYAPGAISAATLQKAIDEIR